MLTSFSDRERILGVLDAGAIGYLLKDADAGGLERGIRAAARGESPLDPRAARAVLGGRARPRPAGGAIRAGARGARARGRRPAEQADRPPPGDQREDREGPSHAACSATIGVTDRTQAALWAERHGLGGS